MAVILCLDTATAVCSVALGKDGEVWQLRESSVPNAHSSLIISFIEEVIASAGITLPMVDAVAVNKGPGSYTGLRIGVSTAKGLCYALDRPLIAISSLRSLAHAMADQFKKKGLQQREHFLFCPMIDARRMEVYSALYDIENQKVRDIEAEVITTDSFGEYLNDFTVVFFGDGALKCREVLGGHSGALIHADFVSSAAHMVPLAEQRFHEKRFVDAAYFEPFYLKDFIPGVPRVKGLHE